MNKYLIGLSLLTLSLSTVPSVKQDKFVELPSKKLSLEENKEDISQYLISEGTVVDEEQRKEMLDRILSITTPTRSAASDSEAFDFFFGVGSEEFWNRMTFIYLPNVIGRLTSFLDFTYFYTNQYYQRFKSDDASDAFRHIYFVSLVANEFGRALANDLLAQGGYNGSDIAQLSRHGMDCHNNAIGVNIGLQYANNYHLSMPDNQEPLNLAKFATHVVKYGSYYDVYEMTANDLGFIHTTEGVRNSLFPPYC